jgi:hypothetical protein
MFEPAALPHAKRELSAEKAKVVILPDLFVYTLTKPTLLEVQPSGACHK